MNFWSRKYGAQEQVLLEPAELDVFVAATQVNCRSAHAFELYRKDSDEVALPAKLNVSAGESRQERAALSAVVRALQASAPNSKIRVICRLKNVVEAIEGRCYLQANADILEEIIALKRSKSISLSAIQPNTERHQSILKRLLNLARGVIKP